MSMVINNQAAKPQKFTEITPGSTVRIERPGREPINNATVIEVRAEHGPHAMPALVYTTPDTEGPQLLMANGSAKVTVLVNQTALATQGLPQNGVVVTPKQVEVLALQYTGGALQATEVIRFAAGKVILRYQDEQANTAEHLVLSSLGAEQQIPVGYWALRGADKVWFVSPDELTSTYDIVQDTRVSMLAQQ